MNACRSVVASAEMIRDAAKLADPTAKGRYACTASMALHQHLCRLHSFWYMYM